MGLVLEDLPAARIISAQLARGQVRSATLEGRAMLAGREGKRAPWESCMSRSLSDDVLEATIQALSATERRCAREGRGGGLPGPQRSRRVVGSHAGSDPAPARSLGAARRAPGTRRAFPEDPRDRDAGAGDRRESHRRAPLRAPAGGARAARGGRRSGLRRRSRGQELRRDRHRLSVDPRRRDLPRRARAVPDSACRWCRA